MVGTVTVVTVVNPVRAADNKPNIVHIVADNLGWKDVGFNGCTDIKTPNIVFGFGHGALAPVCPDALALGGAHSVDVSRIGRDASALMDFSFVTLCTLGYGDIVPVSATARSLAILEVLASRLYLAAFVARLVGVGAMAASARREQ